MPLGAFIREFTKMGRPIPTTKLPYILPPIPVLFSPLLGKNAPDAGAMGLEPGPGPEIPGPAGDNQPPDIDWSKISDSDPNPLLSDSMEEWSYLFQGWCVYMGHTLVRFAQKAKAKQIIKFQAPWLAYAITTYPKYTLSFKRIQAYLMEWYLITDVILAGLEFLEGLDPTDIQDFGEGRMLLLKLIGQVQRFPHSRWTGFMVSSVGTTPKISPVGAGVQDTIKGGLKPRPSSTTGEGSSPKRSDDDDDDEDFNPGDNADKRPDQDQSRQVQWEELFHAWRTDLITMLNAIRLPSRPHDRRIAFHAHIYLKIQHQMKAINLLIQFIATGPSVGSDHTQINTMLDLWHNGVESIGEATNFKWLPATNLDIRVGTIIGPELVSLRSRLATFVSTHPDYRWMG